MSQTPLRDRAPVLDHAHSLDKNSNDNGFLWVLIFVLVGLLALLGIGLSVLFMGTPLRSLFGNILNALFALNSVQALWYVTRAAGLTAYLLLWFSTAWGLAVSSKILDFFLHRSFTYDFHQFISLLAIGFVILHVAVLMADRYLPFSLAEILVPFLSSYRPVWVGIGIIGLYLTLLVTVTFYMRRWIGVQAFRVIHLASFVAFFAAAIHGLYAGTDSPLWTTQWMYAGTTLVIVFLSVYWLVMALTSRTRSGEPRRYGAQNLDRI